MLKRLLFIFLMSFFVIPAVCFATEVYINNKKTEEGKTLRLYYDDLEAGKVKFSVGENGLVKAEVTLDKGRNWDLMSAADKLFSYSYRPLSDEVISPEFLLTFEDGNMRTVKPNITIRYLKKKPDEAVVLLLDKMKAYYENEDINNFINLYSMSFPDRIKFKEAIQNDFFNYKNLRLFYRIDQRIFDDDAEGAICDIYWQRKGDDRVGNFFSDSAEISMRMEKEGNNWMITGLRNNTIFGSSLLGSTAVSTSQPDLSISSSDISGGYVGPNYVVSAVIHNTGNAAANNFKVYFYADDVLQGSQAVGTVSANSQVTLNQSTLGVIPPFTAKVVIDPENVIPESNKANNTASKGL